MEQLPDQLLEFTEPKFDLLPKKIRTFQLKDFNVKRSTFKILSPLIRLKDFFGPYDTHVGQDWPVEISFSSWKKNPLVAGFVQQKSDIIGTFQDIGRGLARLVQ